MNILMIGPSIDAKGGMSTVIKNMYEYEGEDQIKVVSNWHEKHRISLFLKNIFTIRKIIKEEKIDIVHFHVAQKGSFYRKSLLLFLLPRKAKSVFHIHASQFNLFYHEASRRKKRIIRKCLGRADLIVAVSESWQKFYQKITDTPVEFVNNAVKMPQENQYQTTAKRILTLGRIGERKGSYDLLKVAKIVGEFYPEVVFELYGDGEVEHFRQLTRQLPNIKINGWVDQEEKDELFQRTLLHFLPSYNEGLPMAILETMSYGIPNITTNVGGIPQLIENNEDGLLTEPGDVEEMSHKILQYLGKAATEKARFSEKAFKKVKKGFSLDSYMEKWHRIYVRLMSQ